VQASERKEKIKKGELKVEDLGPKKKKKGANKLKPEVEPTTPQPFVPNFVPLKKDELLIVWVPITDVFPNPDNPNEMDDKQFNNLVASIKANGFREPMEIRPIVDATDDRFDKKVQKYEMIGGEHRWNALQVLQWEAVPCIIDHGASTMDKDSRDMLLVSRNNVRGELSPEKFTKLVQRMMPKYGSEILQESMRFADQDAMDEYILEVADTMPTEEMKASVKKQKGKLKTVEDLSRFINKIFSTYGSTVELSFLSFEFGGNTHCIVWMDKGVKALIEEITTLCAENQLDINTIMTKVLTKGWDKTVGTLVLEEQKTAKKNNPAAVDDEDDDALFDDDFEVDDDDEDDDDGE
jgi:hypothetical protein